MKYNIRISESFHRDEEIEANSYDEAQKTAQKMLEELLKDIKITNIEPHIEESPNNWIYKPRGIYLIRKYKRQVPSVCTESYQVYYRRDEYRHEFQYLDNGRYVRLQGKNPVRVLGELCKDGKINKPECNTCVAQFHCYTRAKR